MKLFNYYRSTASYRVRIALNYKNIDHETQDINLVDGEQGSDAYNEINPQKLVPSLQINDKSVITQSLAILEYLEEKYPKPNILPNDPLDKAYIRQLCNLIACDIHPLDNLRVLKYLQNDLNISENEKLSWYHHWLDLGFNAFEQLLQKNNCNGKFCFGENVTMADICLIPQVYNANRYNFDMKQFKLINSINLNCLKLKCFEAP